MVWVVWLRVLLVTAATVVKVVPSLLTCNWKSRVFWLSDSPPA